MARHKALFALVSLGLLCVALAQEGCSSGDTSPAQDSAKNKIVKDVELWQGVILLLCFGAFALFVCLVHRIIRVYVYYDAHLLDTFFDGGGDINMGLIACSIVAKWTWTMTFTTSTADVMRFGLVGHFWFAAGLVIQLFLFAIVAAEIRIKAPGAKTFLQVIYARFGALPHVVLMIFALIVNIMVAGIIMMEGCNILTLLIDDLSKEVVCIIVAIVVGIFTVVGGVGGTIYVAYFSCALIMSIVLVFFTDVFFDPLERANNTLGEIDMVYDLVRCVTSDEENQAQSALTFISRGGMMEGIILILSTFGIVFVDQSFWQSSVAAKPSHSVWGFLTGGLAWFTIPFAFSFAIGMAFLSYTAHENMYLATHMDAYYGYIPVYMSQMLMDRAGSFLMFTLIMVAVMTTASSEVLAASSIIVYDVYQTYIAPFRMPPIPEDKGTLRSQRVLRNEEYLEYDRRCVVLKHVVVISVTCLLIPITLIMMAIDVDVWWLYMFTSILVSACVLPICLAITWHRITGPGVAAGCIGGFCAAFVAWLIAASLQDGGLEKFRYNTGKDMPLILALALAIGLGGLICVLVSLMCGGCDRDLHEDEVWEKTRCIDNPILPWSVKYAPDIGPNNVARGKPHFYAVRRTFKGSEICAYILGVLLAVCAALVWPALMLTADIFTETVFENWTLAILILTAIAAAYLILVPIIWECISICRQAYYNRMWRRHGARERLEESRSDINYPRPISSPRHDEMSDFASTMGSDNKRWKTFINLDEDNSVVRPAF